MDIGSLMVPAAAGLAAMLSVYAFYSFVNASAQNMQFKRRMAAVKDHRAGLRAQRLSTDKAGSDRNLELMKGALEKFKMSDKLWDDSLRMKLARAGRRDRADLVRFLFMQIALPPVLALGALAYYHFFVKPEEPDILNYAMAAVGGFALGYFLPGILLENARGKRQQKILLGYPDALDLLVICVEAGMSMEQSFNRVSQEIGAFCTELAEEMTLTTAELSYLGDRRQALENLAQRTGLAQVKAVTSALIQAERYGTSVAQALRVVSAESRMERLARVEQKAASLPTKMTIPMMVFFLPTLFIVIIGPAIIQMMARF